MAPEGSLGYPDAVPEHEESLRSCERRGAFGGGLRHRQRLLEDMLIQVQVESVEPEKRGLSFLMVQVWHG